MNDMLHLHKPEMKGFKAEKEHSRYSEHLTEQAEKAYKILKTSSWRINIEDDRNNCVMFDDSSVIIVSNIIRMNEKLYILGRKFRNSRNLFTIPGFTSSTLGIYVVGNPGEIKYWPWDSITCKAFKLACTNGYIMYPNIHTFIH